MGRYEYRGNLHVHTVYSDGTEAHAAVASAAARAGLDFLVVTDHNVWVDDIEGYYSDVLVLVGEEIHDVRRRPQGNHLLVYDAGDELAPYAEDPQRLIDEVGRRGGLSFIAHPFERSSPVGVDHGAIPWTDWDVSEYTGLEVWNYMSEFKGLVRNKLVGLIYGYMPEVGIRGPYPATLRKWDQILASGARVAAIGGADAHAETYTLGSVEKVLFPYEYLFRCVNTHVVTTEPLSGALEHDRALIYEALREGRTWVAYDLPARSDGFAFEAHGSGTHAGLGEQLVRTGAAIFEVRTPSRALIRLIRGGKVVAATRGKRLKYTTVEPGAYRVEAYLTYRLRRRGWIFSSPIYVT
jgi:hypothetical protein